MILTAILVIFILLAWGGTIPIGGRTRLWGYGPAGGVSTFLVILIVLLVLHIL